MSNAFVIIKMCYVHNQWYDISCATLCIYNHRYMGYMFQLLLSHLQALKEYRSN